VRFILGKLETIDFVEEKRKPLNRSRLNSACGNKKSDEKSSANI
jgi:hypothetical protein